MSLRARLARRLAGSKNKFDDFKRHASFEFAAIWWTMPYNRLNQSLPVESEPPGGGMDLGRGTGEFDSAPARNQAFERHRFEPDIRG